MLNYKWFISGLLVFISFAVASAGTITLTGNYKGKNIYIRNPYDPNTNLYCIVSVYLNKKQIEHLPSKSAIEIDLSSHELNSLIELKVIYRRGTKPKIINPQAIKSDELFEFTAIRLTKSKIEWATHGESENSRIEVEHLKGEFWRPILQLDAKGQKSDNLYTHDTQHHNGLNKYRIVYIDNSGNRTHSHVYYYESSQLPVSFHPKKVNDILTFYSADPVYYHILDSENNIVKEGRGHNVDCTDLENGNYRLFYDNKVEKIKVKKLAK